MKKFSLLTLLLMLFSASSIKAMMRHNQEEEKQQEPLHELSPSSKEACSKPECSLSEAHLTSLLKKISKNEMDGNSGLLKAYQFIRDKTKKLEKNWEYFKTLQTHIFFVTCYKKKQQQTLENSSLHEASCMPSHELDGHPSQAKGILDNLLKKIPQDEIDGNNGLLKAYKFQQKKPEENSEYLQNVQGHILYIASYLEKQEQKLKNSSLHDAQPMPKDANLQSDLTRKFVSLEIELSALLIKFMELKIDPDETILKACNFSQDQIKEGEKTKEDLEEACFYIKHVQSCIEKHQENMGNPFLNDDPQPMPDHANLQHELNNMFASAEIELSELLIKFYALELVPDEMMARIDDFTEQQKYKHEKTKEDLEEAFSHVEHIKSCIERNQENMGNPFLNDAPQPMPRAFIPPSQAQNPMFGQYRGDRGSFPMVPRSAPRQDAFRPANIGNPPLHYTLQSLDTQETQVKFESLKHDISCLLEKFDEEKVKTTPELFQAAKFIRSQQQKRQATWGDLIEANSFYEAMTECINSTMPKGLIEPSQAQNPVFRQHEAERGSFPMVPRSAPRQPVFRPANIRNPWSSHQLQPLDTRETQVKFESLKHDISCLLEKLDKEKVKKTPALFQAENFIRSQQQERQATWGDLTEALSLYKAIKDFINPPPMPRAFIPPSQAQNPVLRPASSSAHHVPNNNFPSEIRFQIQGPYFPPNNHGGNPMIMLPHDLEEFLKTQELTSIQPHDLDDEAQRILQRDPTLAKHASIVLCLEKNRDNPAIKEGLYTKFIKLLQEKKHYENVTKIVISFSKNKMIQEKCKNFLNKNNAFLRDFPYYNMQSINTIELLEGEAHHPCLKHAQGREDNDYCLNCIFRNKLETFLKLQHIKDKKDLFQRVSPDSLIFSICPQAQSMESIISEAKLLEEKLIEDISTNPYTKSHEGFLHNMLLCAKHLQEQNLKPEDQGDLTKNHYIKEEVLKHLQETTKKIMADKRLYSHEYAQKYIGYQPAHRDLTKWQDELSKASNIEEIEYAIKKHTEIAKRTKKYLEEFK